MKKSCVLAGLVLYWQGVAAAEPPAAPPSSPSSQAPPADSTTTLGLTLPPRPTVPQVDDPMLPLPTRPHRVLSSWAEAIAYLRSQSTDLRTAIDQVLKAEAQTRASLAKYLPSLVGTGQYDHEILTHVGPPIQVAVQEGTVLSTTVPIPNTLTGTLTLSQTLIDLRAFDQIGISRLGEAASRLSVDDKRRTLTIAVAEEILAVVTAERSAEINRGGLRVALEQYAISKQRAALGGSTILDAARAEKNAEDARAMLIAGDEALREAREALGLSLGIPEEVGVAPGFNIDGVTEAVMSSCRPVESLADRPDLAAAQTQLAVAKRSLRNAWLGFLPTLTGSSTVYASTSMPTGFPNPVWDIGALLTVPIWDGGAQYSNLRAARAAEDMAAQQMLALKRADLVEVQQAQRQLTVADVSDRVARRQRDVAARTETLTEIAYVAGHATSLELVTASEAHRQSELNVVVKDFESVKAKLFARLALATCSW